VTVDTSSKHVGMVLALKSIMHSIKCDESQKYERFFSIAYLPKRGGLNDCILAGCLEIGKNMDDGEKQFYNPSKFYEPETLFEAVIHMLATYIAFQSHRRNRNPAATAYNTINDLYMNKKIREKIKNLAEKYYERIQLLSREGSAEG